MTGPTLPPGYRPDGHLHLDDSISPVLVTDVDVTKYAENARGRIAVADDVAIDGRTARDLAYLWRLETAALHDMRAMLISWTGSEPRVTAFLATWAYERYWLARALRDLLDAADRPLQPPGPRPLSARARDVYLDRLLPLTSPLLGQLAGEALTAGHMARMAVLEGAQQVALETLRPRLAGEARDVVDEVARRRTDIVAFFRAETAARVARSTAERALAWAYLQPPWRPLRTVGMRDALEVQALGSIFDDPASLVALAASDTAVTATLPGRPTPSVTLVRRARRRRRPLPTRPGSTHGV